MKEEIYGSNGCFYHPFEFICQCLSNFIVAAASVVGGLIKYDALRPGLVFALVLSAGAASFSALPAEAQQYTVTQITETDPGYDNIRPQINEQGQVAYIRDMNSGGGVDYQIFLYDNGTSTQVSSNYVGPGTSSYDSHFKLNDNGEVVWWGDDNELWLYSGGSAGQITGLSPDNAVHGGPDMNNNGQVVFIRNDNALMLYDNGAVRVVCDNTDPTTGHGIYNKLAKINDSGEIAWEWHDADPTVGWHDIHLISSGASTAITHDAANDSHPMINENGQIAWWSDGDIYFYDGSSVSRVTNDGNNGIAENELFALNDQGRIVWTRPGHVYLYSDGAVTQISPDDENYYLPDINNHEKIVYHKGSGHGVYLNSNGIVSQIDELNNALHARINDNGWIVWYGYNQGWEIFLARPSSASARDFNGDSKSDIVYRHPDTGKTGVWLMDGTTEMSWAYIGNHGTSWEIKGVGDFNGDGYNDIQYVHSDGNLGVWLMNGVNETTWQPITDKDGRRPANHGSWDIGGIADFNNDGQVDVLYRNPGNGNVGIWLMNGMTETTWVYIGNHGTTWEVKGVGDFNSDGRADVLYRNPNGNVGVWLMNGTTETSWKYVGNHGAAWDVKGVADYNSDGRPDVIYRHSSGGVGVWLMNGVTEAAWKYIGNHGVWDIC